MKRPDFFPSLGLTAALALGLGAPAFGSGTTASSPPGFVESIDVRVVEIEAVVTRRGERVEGLTADDFELHVDGKPQAIEYFSEIRSGRVFNGDSDASTVPSPSLGAFAGRSAVPTSYLVFIDDYFSLPSHRNRALRQIEEQLSHLQPEDRLAVVAYDGKVVEMLSSWTGDPRQLERALRRASNRPAFGLKRRSEWQQSLSRLRFQGGRLSGSSFAGIGFSGSSSLGAVGSGRLGQDGGVRLEAEFADKISRVADAAASSLRAFAGPEGRKVLLLLSGRMPGLAGFGLNERQGLFNTLDRFALTRDARRLYSPVVEAANLLGYTVYPVDLGMSDSDLSSAEVGSLAEASYRRRQGLEDDRLAEDSLYFLADETGGRAFFRGTRGQALRKAAEDTRTYYSLGFTPDWQADDKPRSLRIEVKRKDLKVRSRRGFADLSRSTLMSFRVESAHQFDVPLPGAGDLDVSWGAPEPAGFGRVLQPLEIRFSTQGLAWIPSAEGLQAQLELRVAVSDDHGARADAGVIPIQLTYADAGAIPEQAVWQTHLKLRKRGHRLLLALYDPLGEALLAQQATLDL